jgi:hypothetical protein
LCHAHGIRATQRVTWRVMIPVGHCETVTAECCDDHAQAKTFGQTGVIVQVISARPLES